MDEADKAFLLRFFDGKDVFWEALLLNAAFWRRDLSDFGAML